MTGRNTLAMVVDSRAFSGVVIFTIAVNAVVSASRRTRGSTSAGGRARPAERRLPRRLSRRARDPDRLVRAAPWRFFRDGWNVFDFVVIGAAFVPGIRQHATLLRLARLLRVVRIVRVLPDLRVLLLGVWRSIPPLASIGAVTVLILFVYGWWAGSCSATSSRSSGGTPAGRCSRSS